MKIATWNVRGLGGKVKKQEVRKLIFTVKPDFLCLQETKSESIDRRMCQRLWGSSEVDWEAKSSIGRSGGILCLWNKNVFQKQIASHGDGFVCVKGVLGQKNIQCGIINIYSSCNLQEKKELWASLESILKADPDRRWCLAGDFNAVRRNGERRGAGNSTSPAELKGFDDFILNNNLTDLPLSGKEFTCFSQSTSATSRIDRILFCENWLREWGTQIQLALDRNVSDHCPIVLKQPEEDWGAKPFRVLDCWTEHPDFKSYVTDAWNSISVAGWASYRMKEKLKQLKLKLKEWNTNVFGVVDNNINRIEIALNDIDKEAEKRTLSADEIVERRNLTTELWRQKKRKQSVLYQKSRFQWLKLGETNSGFFHRCVNGRRAMNSINGLQIQGEWIQEPSRVKEEILKHFSLVFSETWLNRPKPESIPFNQITTADNLNLTKPFTEEEIKEAVWSCDGSKSPGPDGFNFKFIRKFWELLKSDIFQFIHEFQKHGRLVRGSNPSFITLIPKKSSPQALSDYRPISMIGCLYKILSKLLALRLSKVLSKAISPTHSAFLPDRHITEGVLIANELVEEARRKGSSCVIFKADIEKAFDSVT